MSVRIENNRKPKSSRLRKRRRAGNRNQALSFELLESRQLLAGVTVSNAMDLSNADTSSISALIANDGGDGISLREAIEATNNTTGADTITFDASVFTGGANSLLRLTQGELEVTDSLTIDASDATDVVITGDANGDDVLLDGTFITDVSDTDVLPDNSRVINFTDGSGDLTLTDLTLTGGFNRTGSRSGGGIVFDSNGALTLNQSAVSGNRTGDSIFFEGGAGAGIYSRVGNVSLNNSTVSDNTSIGRFTSGGGIFAEEGSLFLNNSTVSRNTTTSIDGWGGGIFARSSEVTLVNSTLSGNSFDVAYRGGGGGIASLGGTISLTNSTVSENVSTGQYGSRGGGGIYSLGKVLINNSAITNNSTGSSGGGVFGTDGNISVVDSTFSGNTADRSGGGIYARFNDVSLTNSTFSGNTASDEGGGILVVAENRTEASNVSLVNSTVTGNSSTSAGGVRISAAPRESDLAPVNLTIANSIVAGNFDDDGSAPDLNASSDVVNSLVVEHSLIGDTGGSIITSTTGTGNILNQPALLGPLADNGGATLTHALLLGSPAINAGNNALALDENGAPLTSDQRGEVRIIDGTIDIGAVESDFDRTLLLGDVNQDGTVDFDDISPLILLLADNTFLDEADINRDGDVDFDDISPFISLLASRGSAQSNQFSGNTDKAAVSSAASATSDPVAVATSASSLVSPATADQPKSIASVASTAEAPIKTRTSQSESGDAGTLSAAVSQNVKAASAQSQSPLALTNDAKATAVARNDNSPAADTTVRSELPIDSYRGPVAAAPVATGLLGARSGLIGARSNGLIAKQGALSSNEESVKVRHEQNVESPSDDASIMDSFSTAAELFDAHPESLDEVFDLEFGETLAGLIE